MKAHRCAAALLACALLACGKSPSEAPGSATPGPPAERPVVHVPPVETRPFEEGYDAGYALGIREGRPGGRIPAEADAETLARAQAGQDPQRAERWQRGFVVGYIDGVRKVVTGQK